MSLTRTPQTAHDPFASLRGDLRWAGYGVRRETRCALRASLKHHGELDNEASLSFGRLATPPPAQRRRGQKGGGWGSQQPTANSQQPTAGAIAPLGFKPGPSEAKARTNSPYVSACGVVVAGLQSCRRTGLLRDLTRCGCLSGARSAKRVPQRTPQPPRRRLPRSEAKGSRTSGSPFLGLPSFGEAKEGRSAAGPRPGLEKQPPGRDQNRSLNPSGRLSAHPENYAYCTDPSPAAAAEADQTPHPPAASRYS